MPPWLHRRLGFRGTSLLFLSLVWVAVGARIPGDPFDSPGYRLPLEYVPIPVRVGIWWVAAAVAIIAAWWPPGRTKWGFIALSVPASFRAFSYLGAALFYGHPEILIHALLWLGVTGYVVNTSNWPEPPSLDGDDQETHR